MSPARPPDPMKEMLVELRGINRRLDQIDDKLVNGEARQDEVVSRVAQHGAKLESIAERQEESDRRARESRSEMIGMLQRGNVEIRAELRNEVAEAKARVDQITHAVEAKADETIHATAEVAADKAVGKTEESAKRIRKGLFATAGTGTGAVLLTLALDHGKDAAHWLHAGLLGIGAFVGALGG